MAEILAEATGRPSDQVDDLLGAFMAGRPATGDRPLSEAEYTELRGALMGELPGIRRWAVEGPK